MKSRSFAEKRRSHRERRECGMLRWFPKWKGKILWEKASPRFLYLGKKRSRFREVFFRLWLWIAFAVYKRDFSSFLGALIDNELSNTVSGDWERTCRSLKVSGRESTQRKCSEAQTVLQENTDYRTKSQYLCVHLPAISQIKPNYFFL